MKRNLSLILLSISLFQCFAQQPAGRSKGPNKKPNVIFILADDLGYGDLGCYGQELIETPAIDKLAAEGMRFTNFYAGTTVCAPSRAALMTGQHTGRTPVRGNFQMKPEGQLPLPDSAFTVAEMFKQAGYVTGGFGKWGLGPTLSSGDPVNQGFDRFYGYNCQHEAHNFFPDHLWDNTQRINLDNTASQQKIYAPDLIQEKTLAFIDSNRDKPFFIYLAYTLPHAALQLPESDSLFDAYKKKFKEQPVSVKQGWNGVGYQPQAYPRAAYAAMVARLDSYVAQITKQLKKLGLEQNTLIIFTSDNGPHAEGGNDHEFFNSNGRFRGIKRDLYEGGIRAPMIACWPGQIKKGKVSDFPGASWDFLPTFAELVQVGVHSPVDGVSLLPTLTEKGNQSPHAFLYWEFHEGPGRQAIRWGQWKGVKQGVNKDRNAAWELYDLKTDPEETQDVSQKHPAVIRALESIATEEHRASPVKEWKFAID